MTGNLGRTVEIAVGMKAMVVLNIATEADVANGTRGIITGLSLDPRETNIMPDEKGHIHLQYPPGPPPVIYFKPERQPRVSFEGLPEGIIPISPSSVKFSINDDKGTNKRIQRRQLAIVAGYAFTDYKAQGQTIECVLVDIAKPASGALSPFNVYVALSKKQRKTFDSNNAGF